MFKKTSLVLIALAATGFIIYSLFFAERHQSLVEISNKHTARVDSSLSAQETADMRRELTLRVKRDGLEKTYAYLRKNLIQQGSPINHAIQHYFGEMVYDRLGFDGIKLCGYEYPNGCSHGLVVKAVEVEGFKNVEGKIINACKNEGDAKIACVHILGHVYESYFTDKGIPQALAACKKLDLGTDFSACGSGVYMQYYFPDIYEGGSQYQVRKFEQNQAFSLCAPMTDPLFRRSCILFTVEWWEYGLNKDYSKVIDLCHTLDKNDVNDCIGSVGVVVADSFKSSAEGIAGVCDTLKAENERLLCYSGAVRFLISNDKRNENEAANYLCPRTPEQCLMTSRKLYY